MRIQLNWPEAGYVALAGALSLCLGWALIADPGQVLHGALQANGFTYGVFGVFLLLASPLALFSRSMEVVWFIASVTPICIAIYLGSVRNWGLPMSGPHTVLPAATMVLFWCRSELRRQPIAKKSQAVLAASGLPAEILSLDDLAVYEQEVARARAAGDDDALLSALGMLGNYYEFGEGKDHERALSYYEEQLIVQQRIAPDDAVK